MRHLFRDRRVAQLHPRTLLVITVLATLGLSVLVLGVVRLSATGLAGSSHGPGDFPAQHGDQAGLEVTDPVLTALEGILREQGIAAALQHLETQSAANPGVRRLEHHYAIAVGQLSYTQTNDVAESFRLCGAALDTGCYHGVMEAFMASTPRLTREAVARLCDGAPIAAETPVARIQCVHGVGHGLAHASGGRVQDALATCDGFGTDQDRAACYSGVFMQVIEETDERPNPDPFASAPGLPDPFAECTALAERYQRACYVQQTTALLAVNGEDVPAAFTTCDQVPVAYTVPCYQGVGAWISIFTHWDPGQTSTLCQLASLPFRPWCLDGAVAGMASGHATADRSMALCRSTSSDLRTFCFEAIGERIPLLYSGRAAQERACDLAQDPAWIQICWFSAGLAPAGREAG